MLGPLLGRQGPGITLPRLEIFSWTLCGGNLNESFLHHLRTPMIREPTLYNRFDTRGPSEAMIADFISHLPPSLVFLELSGALDWTRANISRYLRSINGLRSLSLISCTPDLLCNVFRSLAPQNGTALLPVLKTLSLHRSGWHVVDELETLLNSRKDLRDKGLRLELTRPSKDDRNKELWNVIAGGLKRRPNVMGILSNTLILVAKLSVNQDHILIGMETHELVYLFWWEGKLVRHLSLTDLGGGFQKHPTSLSFTDTPQANLTHLPERPRNALAAIVKHIQDRGELSNQAPCEETYRRRPEKHFPN